MMARFALRNTLLAASCLSLALPAPVIAADNWSVLFAPGMAAGATLPPTIEVAAGAIQLRTEDGDILTLTGSWQAATATLPCPLQVVLA
jgi:hypothetical protein